VLELYDPDRSRVIVERDGRQEFTRSHDEFEAFAREHFASFGPSRGEGLRVLARASSSPTLERLRGGFLARYPAARWHEWEPLSRDHEREGAVLAFGRPYRLQCAFDRALVIVALDADFLLDHPPRWPGRAISRPAAGRMTG